MTTNSTTKQIESERHQFLQYPLGKFRDPKDDIGKCWYVVNHHYCGLPADDEIHTTSKQRGEPESSGVAERAAQEIVADHLALPGVEQAIAAIIEAQLRSAAAVPEPHRCPHFQPKGEDSGGAYNAKIIIDVTDELLSGPDKDHLHAKPRSWYSLLIKQLIQRIANLRVMLAAANAAPVAPAVTEE